jgi:hypothetical protein
VIEVVRHAERMWPAWFGGDPAPATDPVFLAGGPAHRRRAIVFLFPGGHGPRAARPAVVLKVALTPKDAANIGREFRALCEVRSRVPPVIRASIPEALGLYRAGNSLVLASRAQEGHRLMVPNLTARGSYVGPRLVRRFLARAFTWSNDLAEATRAPRDASGSELQEIAERFLAAYPCHGRTGAEIRAFARSLGRERITWTPSWQHREMSEGNVLIQRGGLRVIDWEHASGRSEPWFDVAYAPGALALLARRQSGVASVRQAALVALGADGWTGRTLRAEMGRAWHHRLPVPWAVALVAMSTALRRGEHGRRWTDWGDLALCLLVDRDARLALSWLAPEW